MLLLKNQTNPTNFYQNNLKYISFGSKTNFFNKEPLGTTAISSCFPNDEDVTLQMRGYKVQDLAKNASYEKTAYLVLNGKLPNEKELKSFQEEIIKNRNISYNLVKEIQSFDKKAHPMDKLQAAVALLKLEESPDLIKNNTEEANRKKAVKLIAVMPTLVACIHRTSNGQSFIPPDPELSQSANFLYMLNGKKPDPDTSNAFEKTMVCMADHGFNASTLATRTTASTLSDMYSSVISGIGTLKGPIHGGANEQVTNMLKEIGSPESVPEFVTKRTETSGENGQKGPKGIIYGFGHAKYKTDDPRVNAIFPEVEKLAEKPEYSKWKNWVNTAKNLRSYMKTHPIKGRTLHPNVDFATGTLYPMIGLPSELYTPIFAMSRVAGWTSHVIEQQKENVLYSPNHLYHGRKNLNYPTAS